MKRAKFISTAGWLTKKSCSMSSKKRLNGNEPLRAAIEAGHNWVMMYDLLEEVGIDTEVAHPLKVKAIADAKIKHDSIDAKTLAHLLRANLIPQVHVPPKDVREQKNLLHHRFWLIKLQTMTKDRIHQFLGRNHVRLPNISNLFGKVGRRFLNDLNLSGVDQKLFKRSP